MMSAPRNLAALVDQYQKSLHEEAEAFGLVGRNFGQAANATAAQRAMELLTAKVMPAEFELKPAPSVESWPKEWEPEPLILDPREIAKG
jgi:hypothetical protein